MPERPLPSHACRGCGTRVTTCAPGAQSGVPGDPWPLCLRCTPVALEEVHGDALWDLLALMGDPGMARNPAAIEGPLT